MPLAKAEEAKTLSPGDWVSKYADTTSAGDPRTRLILLPQAVRLEGALTGGQSGWASYICTNGPVQVLRQEQALTRGA